MPFSRPSLHPRPLLLDPAVGSPLPDQRARSGRGHARRIGTALVLGGLTAGAAVALAAPAAADPSANTWYRLRMCESSNNYSIDTGNDHYGAYQFDFSTWRSVGGSGNPAHASRAEQDARALILYRERGWQPWQCADILGLQEDSDAGSGYIKDISVGGSGHADPKPAPRPTPKPAPSDPEPAPNPSPTRPSRDAPAFPGGSHWYVYGERNAQIKQFQDQMHSRGYFPVGTGEYGPNTRSMVLQLQRLNGLVPNGYIGPNTWRLAWTGRYAAAGHSVSVPAWPGGKYAYTQGDRNAQIKVFQDRMHQRGFFPVGTGEFGPNTLRMVTQLQRLNGLTPNGWLGPNTWRLAWTGAYHD